ncbi:hypothetical protein M408DRAFT_24686 [Serendipita vermifera MAFF 305830]|uniref:C2H2-type domain-containing protein n=1 Tax=Serendipita vermifera MAFF 305830 TaxID=933852 RepID=A0A0C3B4V2_SERVB|nr:hypothetical protein M408DRAFT_24686 [Serendipita vermifera MAFF 305830]
MEHTEDQIYGKRNGNSVARHMSEMFTGPFDDLAFFREYNAGPMNPGMGSDYATSSSTEMSPTLCVCKSGDRLPALTRAAASFGSDTPIVQEFEAVCANNTIIYRPQVDEMMNPTFLQPLFDSSVPSVGLLHGYLAPPSTYPSTIWFPPPTYHETFQEAPVFQSVFAGLAPTATDLKADSPDVPLPAPPPTRISTPPVEPASIQTNPASDVTHLSNTAFQDPSNEHLLQLLQTILIASWYLNNQHEPRDSSKRSVFFNFLIHQSKGVYACLFEDCHATFPRQDRALGHVRKHFNHRPFVCTGPCAATGW